MAARGTAEGNAVRLFLGAVLSIFAAEIAVMFILPYFPSLTPVQEAVVDGLLLSLISLPMFYLFLLRPLLAHVRKIQEVDIALRESHEMLEDRVREQTTDLLRANQFLQREISQKEQAILSREKAEKVFRSIFEMSHDAIFVADAAGNILAVNAAGATMFGYPRDRLARQPLTMLMPERYRDRHVKGLAGVVARGQSAYLGKTVEFHGLRQDGSEFPLELNITKWHSNGDICFSGILRDISERRAAEEALRNSEAKLNGIFNSTLDGILVADTASGKFLTGNRAICEMLGYSLEELARLKVDDIHPAKHLPQVREQFARQARQEINLAPEIPVQRKDGTLFFADIVSSPMHIGEKRYLIGVFRDATERREAEARLRQSQKLEAIGTLAGGIAHDFNNILAAILGFSELALDGTIKGSAIHADLQQVVKAGKRAKELIRQILTLSRQSAMELSLQRLQVIVKEVVKLLRATIPATIDIRREVDADCQPVLADPTQIHQILMNLCTNAFHAMEQSGGVLTISLREVELAEAADFHALGLAPGRYVRLEVTDTGSGMEQKVLDHIFEPYYTTKPLGKGSGLGLAVVHGIVENHGGKIVCRSKPGTGTTFSVLLPVAARSTESAAEAGGALTGGSERILFVDDEEALAQLGKKILQPLGYTVCTSTDSVEALNRFQASPGEFDLVITDHAMPGMSGENLARKILAVRPEIPIILCTGHSSIVSEETTRSIGIAAFLLKPVDRGILAETIRRVLDAGKQEQGR
jgi:PAS domain S-box-containing protein